MADNPSNDQKVGQLSLVLTAWFQGETRQDWARIFLMGSGDYD
jgi:hypothetical protein